MDDILNIQQQEEINPEGLDILDLNATTVDINKPAGLPHPTKVANNSIVALLSAANQEDALAKYKEGMELADLNAPSLSNPYAASIENDEIDARIASLREMAKQAGIDVQSRKIKEMEKGLREVDPMKLLAKKFTIANTTGTGKLPGDTIDKTVQQQDFDLAKVINDTTESLKRLDQAKNANQIKLKQMQDARNEGQAYSQTANEMIFYFVPMVDSFMTYAMSKGMGMETETMGAWRKMKAALLPGEARAEMKRFYNSLSNEEKIVFNKKFGEYLSSPDLPVIISSLGLNALEELYSSTTNEESESAVGRVIYDIFGAADILGIGSIVSKVAKGIRGASKGAKVVEAAAQEARAAEHLLSNLNDVHTNPARSPKGVADATNNEIAKELTEVANEAQKAGALDIAEGVAGGNVNTIITDNMPTNGIVLRDKPKKAITQSSPLGPRPSQGVSSASEAPRPASEVPSLSGRKSSSSPAVEADMEIATEASRGGALGYTEEEVSQLHNKYMGDFNNAIKSSSGADGTEVVQLAGWTSITDDGDAAILKAVIAPRSTDKVSSFKIPAGMEGASPEAIYKAIKGKDLPETATAYIGPKGNRLVVKSMFAHTNGVFNDADEALKQVKFLLRDFGATDDSLSVMIKQGGTWIDFNPAIHPSKGGEYAVNVAQRINYAVTDLNTLATANMSRIATFFDRIPYLSKWGVSNNLMDVTNRFESFITRPMAVASFKADRVSKLLKTKAGEFYAPFNKLSSERKRKIMEYLSEANNGKVQTDSISLAAAGFSSEEQGLFKSWRKYWDTAYEIENQLLRHDLQKNGWQKIVGGDVEGYGKGVSREAATHHRKAYDSATQTIRELSNDELDELYKSGGSIARFRRPVDLDVGAAENIVVRGNSDNYLRKISDSDRPLNYVENYFTRTYGKTYKFIDATLPDGSKRTVAISKDTVSAKKKMEELQLQYPGTKYEMRGDRSHKFGSDEYMDSLYQSGRLSQRQRGRLLMGAQETEGAITDPINALEMSIRGISEQSSFRREIDNIMDRVKIMYADELDKAGAYKHGELVIPSDPLEIKGTTRRAAELRSYINHINMLTEGYANKIDDILKGVSNIAAETFGKLAVEAGEGALQNAYSGAERLFMKGADTSASALIKGGTSTIFIGWNPFRQILLQSSQALQTVAIHPMGWATGRIQKLQIEYRLNKLGWKNSSAKTQLYEKIEKMSGIMDGVDAHLLANADVADFAYYGNEVADMARKGWRGVVDIPRKLGMGLGEQMNRQAHLMTFFDRAYEKGIDLTIQRNAENLIAEAFDFMGNLHRAAPLAYNNNTLSIFAQFMQVPHKIALTAFNRNLSLADRAKFIAANTAIYGVPMTALIDKMFGTDVLDKEDRDTVQMGILGMTMNWILGLEGNEKVDTRELSPIAGFMDMVSVNEKMDSSILEMVTKSPFVEGSKRLSKVYKALTSFTTINDDFPELQADGWDVVREVARLSSGYTNAEKAYMAYNLGHAIDSKGRKYPEYPVDAYGAVAQLFGLPKKAVVDNWETRMEVSKITKERSQQIREELNEIFYRARQWEGMDDTDIEFQLKVTRVWLTTKFANDTAGQQEAQNQIKSMLRDPESNLYKAMVKIADIPDKQKLISIVKDMPDGPAKDALLAQIGE